VERGRNITSCSTDTDEEKLNWMTQLLSNIVTLLQNQTDLKLEAITAGGHADSTPYQSCGT
jgi:hypothetical protein